MNRTSPGLLNRMRFKNKLFLSYMVVVIIPILILGIYAYNQSRQMLDYRTLEGIDKNITTVTGSIDSSLERYSHTLRSITYNVTFQKIVENDYLDLVNLSRDLNGYLTPYFNMMKNLDNDIAKITLYAQGDVPEYDTLLLSSERVDDKAWYRETLDAPPNEYRWFYDEGLFVTAKFPRSLGSAYTHVVHMSLKAESIFGAADMQHDNGIVIADGQGRPIYANAFAARFPGFTAEEMLKQKDGTVKLGDTRLFLARKPLRQSDWTIYWFVPADRAATEAGSIISATVGMIVICVAIMLAVITLFSRTMIRRILALNVMMKKVEMGNLTLDVRSVDRDEIGELTNRFGSMLGRINELIEESYNGKIKQQEAELKALQWQINPHFLYNALSFINWKALRKDAYDISHTVTSLSRFYRTALNRGSNIISVRDELDNVRSYLEVIQLMQDYSFDVVFEIDEAVLRYSTINLILQPLVENAIQHGVNKKSDGRGTLRVSAAAREGAIVFTVRDNGPGMPEELVRAAASTQSGGYGLKNVNERVKLKFGEEYGISIASEPEEGTTIELTVPPYFPDTDDK
ncbi:sensor histidine kinase [Cohnella phaseoli]|uniref:histidine kinase n=1 Tax=Cohnella phaseoli TaxID=456490 RepID=A0A3D9HYR4_9BACL|nr:histidine kinase [Cohnella phaseoli]RED54560.1 two-component system sensor histidine kinase YesM [Cohnella phaseoli]